MLWEPDPIAAHVGGFAVRYASVYLIMSFVLGFFLYAHKAQRRGRTLERCLEILPYALVGALGGGRLGFFLFEIPATFLADPKRYVLYPGFSACGTALGLILAVALFAKSNKFDLRALLDDLTEAAAMAALLMALGSAFDSTQVGIESGGPLSMYFPRYDQEELEPPLRLATPFLWCGWTVLCWLGVRWVSRSKVLDGRAAGVLSSGFLAFYFLGLAASYSLLDLSRALEPESTRLWGIALCASAALLSAGDAVRASVRLARGADPQGAPSDP